MGTRCADHVTPLYPQKLALTSPTIGGRSVGIVRVRTKATEFSLIYMAVEIYHSDKAPSRPTDGSIEGWCCAAFRVASNVS